MSLFSTLMNNTRASTSCLVSLCDSVPNAPSIENFPFPCMIVSTYATLLGNWIIAPFSVNDCEFGGARCSHPTWTQSEFASSDHSHQKPLVPPIPSSAHLLRSLFCRDPGLSFHPQESPWAPQLLPGGLTSSSSRASRC